MLRVSIYSMALVSAEMSWEEFKSFYGKALKGTADDSSREQVYNSNVQKIKDHNARNETWTMAVNSFADLTQDEFLALVSRKAPREFDDVASYGETHTSDAVEVPSSIDWTKEGVVNSIRKQGPANSCWTFATVGALESAYALATGNLVELSEQQLCDCSNAGSCANGGDEQDAIPWYKNHGACGRANYPYTGTKSTCRESSCDILVPQGAVTGIQLAGTNAASWKTALAKTPITTGISPQDLQLYNTGVVTAGCTGSGSDHAVLAVGYGTDGQDYFKIRNSWGDRWGEQGYVRVAQSNSASKGTACIFQWQPAYPTIGAGPTPSPSPSPSPKPSPRPSPVSCSDQPSSWTSSEGDSCSVYQNYNYCTPAGAEGSGWKRSRWGPITNFGDSNGITALDACCACGGGSTRVIV